ncbi:unnamed protein product, partial [Mesorhabditis spiculigera]
MEWNGVDRYSEWSINTTGAVGGAAASSSRRQKQLSKKDKQATIDDALVEETLRPLDELVKQVRAFAL